MSVCGVWVLECGCVGEKVSQMSSARSWCRLLPNIAQPLPGPTTTYIKGVGEPKNSVSAQLQTHTHRYLGTPSPSLGCLGQPFWLR